VIRVIDVAKATDGRVAKILLNADLDKAMACIAEPGSIQEAPPVPGRRDNLLPIKYWLWRKEMAERIALDAGVRQFGVEAMYIFGSVKNAVAGPASDIDLLVHFRGDEKKEARLLAWLEGWSRCLAEINYLKTGYRTDGLLDVHLVTDLDIENKTSYAVKIGAVTDAAQKLPLS
jgi:predicted nucleotidyltransferase